MAGVIGCVVVAVLAYGAATIIDQGRTTGREQWRLAATVGAGTSTALIVILAAAVALAWRRKRPVPGLRQVLAGLGGALLLITVVALRTVGSSGSPPPAWEVGLAAFFLPVACLALLLIPLVTWRRRTWESAHLPQPIAVTVTASDDRWRVRWIGMGRIPADSYAPTLGSALDGVLAAAPGVQHAAELRITIYPVPYRGGPSFDMTGKPGDFTAITNRNPLQDVRGSTVKDLIRSIEQLLTDNRGGFRLRWIRGSEMHAP